MKKDSPYFLNSEDKKIVNIFAELGMPKNLAKTLTYISRVNECRSADIEKGANLRQPEVSVAMQHLQRKEWISKRDVKKEGKGRPIYFYKLEASLDVIVKDFEKEKQKEIETIKKDIGELKSLLS